MCINGAIFEYDSEEDYLEKKLKGWGFDVEALKESEGAFSLSPPKGPRAFSTNVSNESTTNHAKDASEWCYYAGMPSPSAYMEKS